MLAVQTIKTDNFGRFQNGVMGLRRSFLCLVSLAPDHQVS